MKYVYYQNIISSVQYAVDSVAPAQQVCLLFVAGVQTRERQKT